MMMQSLLLLLFQSVDLYQHFSQWQLEYKRQYTTQSEEIYRFNIFIENWKLIQGSSDLRINQFADLSEEEFIEIYLNRGLQQPTISNTNTQYNYIPIDWTSKLPGIRDQEKCVDYPFSAVEIIEMNALIQFNIQYSLSVQDIIDCSTDNNGCQDGSVQNSLNYVKSNGIATAKDYPYKGTDTDACKLHIARTPKISDYLQINDCDSLAEGLQKGPISIMVDASNWMFYGSGILSNCNKVLNHSVTLVGINESGVWKVRNGWSSTWGEQGYIRLAAGDTCGICQRGIYPIVT